MPVWQAKRRPQDLQRDRRTGGFAEPHIEIDKRLQPDLIEQHAMARFGRDMRGLRMRKRISAQLDERRHSRRADEAVEQHRNILPPCRKRRPENGGKLAAAEARQRRERIVERATCRASARSITVRLRASPSVIDAGAATGPALTAAAKQRGGNGGRRRGIADPHFAETHEIAVGGDGVMTGCDRGNEFAFAHRRRLREIRGRLVERKRNDAQRRRRQRARAD